MELCAQLLPAQGQIESVAKGQDLESIHSCPGIQQGQYVHRRTVNSWYSAGKCYIPIFSPRRTTEADDEPQCSPELESQIPGAEQPTHRSLLKPVPKEQPGAYEYVEAAICVF